MKKTLALILAALAVLLCFAACGKKDDTPSVYYLNFKPEQDTQWKALAKTDTEKTGIPVTVAPTHLRIPPSGKGMRPAYQSKNPFLTASRSSSSTRSVRPASSARLRAA